MDMFDVMQTLISVSRELPQSAVADWSDADWRAHQDLSLADHALDDLADAVTVTSTTDADGTHTQIDLTTLGRGAVYLVYFLAAGIAQANEETLPLTFDRLSETVASLKPMLEGRE